MDEHRAHWPTRRRLLLRLGEARARAPRCETIEARPERAPRRASPRRSHRRESRTDSRTGRLERLMTVRRV